jgi:hypothetical protein
MIQNLKGNIHREKTEKLELKRMLQDARDELEAHRGKLGSGNSEVLIDDPNWEKDDGQQSPSHAAIAVGLAAVEQHDYVESDPVLDYASLIDSTPASNNIRSTASQSIGLAPTVDSGYVSRTSSHSLEKAKDSKAPQNPFVTNQAFILEENTEDIVSQKSAQSFLENVSSVAPSLMEQDIKEIAQGLILEILEEDKVLNPLFKKALKKHNRQRVVKNLARFIYGYCVLLGNANPSPDQKKVVRFLRHRARQFASLLCEHLDPSKLEIARALALEEIRSRAAERRERLRRWMFGEDILPTISPARSVASDDEDGNDDESLSGSEGLPAFLEDIKTFLVHGEPLELFRQNFACFVAGESIETWNSMIKSRLPAQIQQGVHPTKKLPVHSDKDSNCASPVELRNDAITALEDHSGFQVSWRCVSSYGRLIISEPHSNVSQRCNRKFKAQIPGNDMKAAIDFLRQMDWNIKRDGPMVNQFIKSDWLENLLWTLAPSLLGRFPSELSSNQAEGDLEAGRDLPSAQSVPDSANQAEQDIQTKKVHRSNLKDPEDNELVFICLFNRRSRSWRLCHAKVRRSSKAQSSGVHESQDWTASESIDTESQVCSQNMDKALFLALRDKLLGERLSKMWNWIRWFSPIEISGLEFWEVRPVLSSS